MVIPQLAVLSLQRRSAKAWVAVISLSLSTALLLAMFHIKNSLSQQLQQALNQSDLLIGAPAQPVHLVLFGLFRIGNPPPGISMDVYHQIQKHPETASAIPLRMMESHRGFTVTATSGDFMDSLKLSHINEDNQDNKKFRLLLGANVAHQTGLQSG